MANDHKLGMFAIDDNVQLLDSALPRFTLEMRDISIPIGARRFLPNKGWKKVTTKECIATLVSAGCVML